MFLNRDDDIRRLLSLWKDKAAQLVVCYGRRRVGKTALLEHFSQKQKILHWIAYRSTSYDLLRDFSKNLFSYTNAHEKPNEDFTFGTWKNAFDTLALHAEHKRIGVIIDEFPYLVEADPSIPSILQASWDKHLSKSKIFLGLSGSRIGMIHDEILSPRAPLYGRSTGIMYLEPIHLKEIRKFYPLLSIAQLIEVYGITGGVPKYFEFIKKNQLLFTSLEEAIKNKTTFLTTEAQFLLHEEFRETKIFLGILRALGNKNYPLNDLAHYIGVDSKALTKYLDQLINLKIIARIVPADMNPNQSRKGIYEINDLFLRFYFYFIEPFRQDIENSLYKRVIDHLKKNFESYIGRVVFEKLCNEWLYREGSEGRLPFLPKRVGKYWDKKSQIDVMAVNHTDKMMILGECKWTQEKIDLQVVKQLEAKAKLLSFKYDYHYQLFLFSKSGFQASVIRYAEQRNYRRINLEALFIGFL